MRITTRLATAATLLLSIASAVRADEEMAKKLGGTYTIESGKDGTLVIPKERLQGMVRIVGDKITLFDADNKELYVIEYETKGDSMPAKVDMEVVASTMEGAKGSKALGLLKLDGETLTIMYDFGDDALYPEAFVPQTDKQHLFVMKRKGGN